MATTAYWCTLPQATQPARTAGWLRGAQTRILNHLYGGFALLEPAEPRCELGQFEANFEFVSEVLQQAIRNPDGTLYRIARDADID